MTGPIIRLRHMARSAYSPHPAARLFRIWRSFSIDPSGQNDYGVADILLLPLAGLAVTLWVLISVPGASDAISMACSSACMP
jgi:hypothetical protein